MQILGGGFHELIPGGAEVSQTRAVNGWAACTIGLIPLASCDWCVVVRLRQASALSATTTNVRCVLSCLRLLVNPWTAHSGKHWCCWLLVFSTQHLCPMWTFASAYSAFR